MGNYNGWTNRETWLVPLWFEDGLDHVVEDISANSREEWILSASEALQDYFDEFVSSHFSTHEILQSAFLNSGTNGKGIILDLLNGAVARINWYEIAEHMADEFYTETEKENDNA